MDVKQRIERAEKELRLAKEELSSPLISQVKGFMSAMSIGYYTITQTGSMVICTLTRSHYTVIGNHVPADWIYNCGVTVDGKLQLTFQKRA